MALQNTQRIQIELDGNPPFEYVVVKQGEKGSRIVEVTLLENKAEFEIPSGTTAKIKYYKPDGKKTLNPCTISGNVIKVEYSEQMLAAAGTGRGEIVLYNGDNVLRSATYYTKIVETVYKENGLISENEFLDMAESIIKVNQATDKAINAGESAEEAAEEANTAATAANEAAEAAEEAEAGVSAAISEANTKAAAANTAAQRAEAAAAACENIADGMNSMADDTTGITYTIGISGGMIYLESEDE